MFKNRKKLIIIISIIVVGVLISLAAFAFRKEKKEEYITAQIEKSDLIQTVSEVGAVKAVREIDLSFLSSGNIAKKYVEIGSQVKKDQVLAELDYQALLIQRDEAQSNLDVARANLNKTLSGATAQEVAVLRAQVEKARKAYLSALDNLEKAEQSVAESISQAEKSLYDLESDDSSNITTYEQSISSAQIDLDNTKITYQKDIDNYTDTVLTAADTKLAVANTAMDEINSIVSNNDIKDYLSSKNSYYLDMTKETYFFGQNLFEEAKENISLVNKDSLERKIDEAINDSLNCLNKVFDSLNYCYSALEASTINETDLDAYKTIINTQITAVITAIDAVQTAQQSLEDARLTYDTKVSAAEDDLKQAQVSLDDAIISAKNALASAKTSGDEKIATSKSSVDTNKEAWEVAKRQLDELRAPARPEDIALYKAKVNQAQASLNLTNKQIEDSIIKSPIDGKIVEDEYDIGEQVLVGKAAFSVLGEDNFEVEVDISESDIAKVKEGNKVEITMDAFGEDISFVGSVYFIEPAETIISEVIYYKVKIRFSGEEEELGNIKSGMTANVIITTNERKDVLVMPSRAIIEKSNGDKKVRVLQKGQVVETQVRTGLRGDGGLMEVLSGVKEGDEVVISIKK